MGTSAGLIIKSAETDRFNVVYVHYDGYPSHTGRVLHEQFTEEDSVQEFLNSCLLGNSYVKGFSLSDRNHSLVSDGTGPETFDSYREALRFALKNDVVYEWDDQTWNIVNPYNRFKTPLKQYLKDECE